MELSIEEVKEMLKNHKSSLKASQDKVSFPILQRITKRLSKNYNLGEVQVDKGLIVNGHHRYVSHILLQRDPPIVPWTKSSGQTYNWEEVLVVEDDHDNDEQRAEFERRFPIH